MKMNKLMMMAAVCCFFVMEAGASPAGTKATEYVRLAIDGTRVNARRQPFAAGPVLVRMNTGDFFIAEKEAVVTEQGKSGWYKIVLAVDSATNELHELSKWDPRFKVRVAFVHADYAIASPLLAGDREKIMASPLGVGHPSESIIGWWSYMYTTEGDQEKPYHISEYDVEPPWIQVNYDNTFSAHFYESWLAGTLLKTGDNTYRFKDVMVSSEGEQSEQEMDDVIRYDPAKGMLCRTVSDTHHYFAPFSSRNALSSFGRLGDDNFIISEYDTPGFDGQRHKEALRRLSDDKTFAVIHERTVAALAAKHQEWLKSKPDFELISDASGCLFDNGGDDDHAFVVHDKKKSIITIIVYDDADRAYYELYREMKVEGGLLCDSYASGADDFVLGECVIERATQIKNDPASLQNDKLCDIYDLMQYYDPSGCFSPDFRLKRPLNVLSIATSTIYQNCICMMYDRETNTFKMIYGQAYSD